MSTTQEIKNNLNKDQLAAVEYNDGPMLVIAGAGSGKTRVITYKIAHLIQNGIKPWNILALTFTNKAANEMKERISQLVGDDNAHYINMGTFHSILGRILRIEAQWIGYTPDFTIYDEADSHSLIKTIIREKGIDDKVYKPSSVYARISLARNNMIDHVAYSNDLELYEYDKKARMPRISEIFTAYEQRCKLANAIDFDDLLLLTYRLFCSQEEVRRRWEERFKYILVDEYQDTNKVQHAVLRMLTRNSQHVCVVGDDAQSIYAFRGANLDNILLFSQTYPSAKLFKLEQNYRSTQLIVKAANSLISHNKRQISKDVFSENEKGEPITLKCAFSDTEEAAVVCNELRRLQQKEGLAYSQFAILYRTHAQSRSFEDTFRREGIPYRIYGGLSFYQRKEIKDIIAYYRLVVNPNDEEAFKRIINYPARGIGQTTLARITACALQSDVSHWQVCCSPDEYHLEVNASTKSKIGKFVELITSFRERLNSEDALSLGQDIITKSGIYADIFASSNDEDIARQENINEFGNALNDFVERMKEEDRAAEALLPNFLQEVSLQTDIDNDDDKDKSRVSLMTVHAAKGLEFMAVFIVGLEENLFPSQRALSSLREIEEERRLLYVAITRAEKHCIMTYAKNRWRYGKMEFFPPSRFLKEIDERYLNIEQTEEKSSHNMLFGSIRQRPFLSSRLQNSRPVASQFLADKEYKVTPPRQKEPEIDPFSPSFHKKLDAARGAKPTKKVTLEGQKNSSPDGLKVGMVIEHQRFGRGTVIDLEGEGESLKATVKFVNMGTKQLLLKFAKYSVVR